MPMAAVNEAVMMIIDKDKGLNEEKWLVVLRLVNQIHPSIGHFLCRKHIDRKDCTSRKTRTGKKVAVYCTYIYYPKHSPAVLQWFDNNSAIVSGCGLVQMQNAKCFSENPILKTFQNFLLYCMQVVSQSSGVECYLSRFPFGWFNESGWHWICKAPCVSLCDHTVPALQLAYLSIAIHYCTAITSFAVINIIINFWLHVCVKYVE